MSGYRGNLSEAADYWHLRDSIRNVRISDDYR